MSTRLIGIIDYGLGNLRSVSSAVGKIGHNALITSDAKDLAAADGLILPGVGAFGDAVNNLKRLGLDESLGRFVLGMKKPILGICLGSQLMAKESFEFGHYQGLGWIDAEVVRVEAPGLPVPHVGWNGLYQVRKDILFDGIPEDALFYYVHSYHVKCREPEVVIGQCEYGARFNAAFHRDNIYAVQFHPEKSQLHGLNLIRNFVEKAIC
jgi:imidazole glycerol-phosphate synthase subunit HisH